MASYDQRSLAAARWRRQRPAPSGFGELWQRAVNLFASSDRPEPDRRVAAAGLPEAPGAPGEEFLPRFPLARHGYDRMSVDQHVAQLERELAELDRELVELRAGVDSSEQVASEIKRVGEQTAAVLVAANEQRQEMLRNAQAEADRLLAAATANASAVTAQAEARVRELEAQNEAARRQRERLLEELRRVASGIGAVAEAAQDRSPAM